MENVIMDFITINRVVTAALLAFSENKFNTIKYHENAL